MKPITREEQYLNRLTGEEGIIPDKPVTREEQYFARLCGENNVIPDKPVTRREQYLATLCGEDVITPTKPVTRIEQYMAFASGESESKPEKPITREEMYWDKYQGGDVPEEKTIAFTDIITVTDALARPAVDLQSEITATQNLNGYEYPWVGGAGVNQWNEQWEIGGINWQTGDNSAETDRIRSKGYIAVNPNTTYYFTPEYVKYVWMYDESKTIIPNISGSNNFIQLSPQAHDFTTTSDCRYIRFIMWTTYGTTYNHDISLNYPHTVTTYQPYENICPISGRTEVNVTRTGKNLLDWKTVWADYLSDGVLVNPLATVRYTIPSVFIGKQLTFSAKIKANSTNANCRIVCNVNGTRTNGNLINNITDFETSSVTFTPQSTSDYIYTESSGPNGTYKELQLEISSTATAYEPYEGDTFNTELGRTVYGGTLDLTTGELKITHAYVDLGDLTWTKFNNVFEATINDKKNGATNFITTSYRTVEKAFTVLENGETTSTNRFPVPSIFIKDERVITPQEFKTLVTGQKMVYELATPQTISLTPTEVQMLENNNTIWADSGRVQLTYLSKAAERVQTMNASLKANTLKLTKGAIK